MIVADNEYEYNGNLPIIRWNKDIKTYKKILIFRIINYDNQNLINYYNKNFSFQLSPEDTKKILGDIYPEIIILE